MPTNRRRRRDGQLVPGRAHSRCTICAPIEGCVDKRNTHANIQDMKEQSTLAEVNIHLRARPQDKKLIDQAAELVGANRSQFMLASAVKEAKNILLDQSTIHADAKAFQKIMDWIDTTATSVETTGMKRILQSKAPWQSD
jgi:uncharacterized protein (DUF1778 family)